MGKVFKPDDLKKGRKYLEEATKDLSPGTAERVRKVLREADPENVEDRLSSLIGDEEAEELLKKLRKG